MPKVNFVRWTTTRNGRRIYASDYGYRAFPIPEECSRAGRSAPRFEPIRNGVLLANGLQAGDQVTVRGLGKGTILLVTKETLAS
jgi:hypothetical protein